MSSDDEEDVRMGDDGGESEALSGTEEPDADDDDYEDSVFVDGDEEDEEEEEDEETADLIADSRPAARVIADPPTPPNARVSEIMRYIERAKEGDVSHFVTSSSETFQHFPTLRVVFNACRLGEMHDTDANATYKSHISGRRADKRVYPYNKKGRMNPIYFHHTEQEIVQRFMVLSGFSNPRWKGYSEVDTRSLAEFYQKSVMDINKLEYGS